MEGRETGGAGEQRTMTSKVVAKKQQHKLAGQAQSLQVMELLVSDDSIAACVLLPQAAPE